jgi:hypothetical protein
MQYNGTDKKIDKLFNINRKFHKFSITISFQIVEKLYDKLFNKFKSPLSSTPHPPPSSLCQCVLSLSPQI